MEEPRKFKKYIYISKEVKPAIEDYCTKNNITLVTRFINEYNLGKIMQTELRNLNSVNYLILDLSAFTQLTDDDDIISKIVLIRKLYKLRIIIIAEDSMLIMLLIIHFLIIIFLLILFFELYILTIKYINKNIVDIIVILKLRKNDSI